MHMMAGVISWTKKCLFILYIKYICVALKIRGLNSDNHEPAVAADYSGNCTCLNLQQYIGDSWPAESLLLSSYHLLDTCCGTKLA